MAINLSPITVGLSYPLLPPDGGQAPVRGSSQDPAQEPAPSADKEKGAAAPGEPTGAAPAPTTATAPAGERPVEAGAESQGQDGKKQGRKQGYGLDTGIEDRARLSPQEQAQVRQLQARDREVRAHEQAHVAAGGRYAGGAHYTYKMGPDGRRYAVAGEVPIDTSKASTPEQTIQKARTVRKAALAPAKPSAADRQVAAKAAALEQEARRELIQEKQEQAEQAAQDQAQKHATGGATGAAAGAAAGGATGGVAGLPHPPSRLPQAPPYAVRVNPLNKVV